MVTRYDGRGDEIERWSIRGAWSPCTHRRDMLGNQLATSQHRRRGVARPVRRGGAGGARLGPAGPSRHAVESRPARPAVRTCVDGRRATTTRARTCVYGERPRIADAALRQRARPGSAPPRRARACCRRGLRPVRPTTVTRPAAVRATSPPSRTGGRRWHSSRSPAPDGVELRRPRPRRAARSLPDGTVRQLVVPALGRACAASRSTSPTAATLMALDGVAYNARGQRTRAVLGNGVVVEHTLRPARRSRRAASSATPPGDRWRAGSRAAGPALHLRPVGQRDPAGGRGAAAGTADARCYRAHRVLARGLHLRRRLPAARGDRPRAPGAAASTTTAPARPARSRAPGTLRSTTAPPWSATPVPTPTTCPATSLRIKHAGTS